ncbi:hypothetical protein ES703_45063 [subsurface metagenome]
MSIAYDISRLQLLMENPELIKWEDDVIALKKAILALEALRSIDAITSAWHSAL